jgi:hypothetical protein
MLRLFQAGIIAALMQGLAILLATLLAFSDGHHRIGNLKVPADDQSSIADSSLAADAGISEISTPHQSYGQEC